MKMSKTIRRAISLLLLVMMVASFATTAVLADDVQYFPQYKWKTTSIVNALADLGIDYSYAYRAKIAAANGIVGYRGTAQQNLYMVELLMDGRLVKPVPPAIPEAKEGYFPPYCGNTTSIVNALAAIGAHYSFYYRAQIAAVNGIENYKGTAYQNTCMLHLLKAGDLKKPW